MKKVLVFGSLNMDVTIECDAMPQAGQTVDGRNYFTNPGGKGGNQAVAAAKLGAPTYMIARVGDDAFGEQMRRSLEGYGDHVKGRCRDRISDDVSADVEYYGTPDG